MKRRIVILDDDLDDYYLKGDPDSGVGIALAIIVIVITIGFWTGIIH